MLEWLTQRPGDGWQERWDSCEANLGPLSWVAEAAATEGRSEKNFRNEITSGLAALLLCRLVLPSYDFLVGYGAVRLFTDVRTELSVETFTRAEEAAHARGNGRTPGRGSPHRPVQDRAPHGQGNSTRSPRTR